jgi:hypothetical protein
MRITLAALVTMLCGFASVGYAQQAPVTRADVAAFEGTWVLDVERSGLTSAQAERRVITTGTNWMRIELHRSRDAYPVALIYNFDGSSTVNPFGGGTAESKLVREGEGFLLHTVFTVRDQPITVHELLPSRPDGAELVIDMMLRVEHGYQGVAPAAGRTPPNVAKAMKFFQRQP